MIIYCLLSGIFQLATGLSPTFYTKIEVYMSNAVPVHNYKDIQPIILKKCAVH